MAKQKKNEEVRKIEHENIYAELYLGEEALSVKDAQDLLGWTVVTKEQPHHFRDRYGDAVYLKNMVRNRPFDIALAENYAYQILKRQWADSRNASHTGEKDMTINGESLSISRTGIVVSGNHRLAAVVFAKQIWEGPQKEHWSSYWKEEPSLECLIVYGVGEGDHVVNTVDTGRRRSTADSLYRSDMFQKFPEKSKDSTGKTIAGNKRKEIARMAEYAIDFVWSRTGRKVDAFSGKARTHMDAYAFLEAHPRLLKACEHIHTEDQPVEAGVLRPISGSAVSQGVAAGMLYLMGASGDADKAKKYLELEKDDRAEKVLGKDWPTWDKATSFWTEIAIGLKGKLRAVLDAINEKTSAVGQGQATKDERVAILARAWMVFKEDRKVTPSTCALKAEHYASREGTDQKIIKDNWTVGGIDVGDPRFQVGGGQTRPRKQERGDKSEGGASSQDAHEDLFPTEEGRDADGFPLEDPAAAFTALTTAIPESDPSPEEQAEIQKAIEKVRATKERTPSTVRKVRVIKQ